MEFFVIELVSCAKPSKRSGSLNVERRKVRKMEEEFQRSQKEAVEKALKRTRRERSYKFKKRGHQVQSNFNECVVDCFKRASAEMMKRLTDQSTVEKAREALELMAECKADNLAAVARMSSSWKRQRKRLK